MREFLSYSFLMPPTILIVICLAGALIALARPRVGTVIVLTSSICIYLFATPVVLAVLLQPLVSLIPKKVDFSDAQAIVVTCADMHWGNNEDIPASVGDLTLQRLASAARLYRRLRLPIAVSGPNPMRQELEENFFVPVQFFEDKSRNTFENALYTARILQQYGITEVIIVAQARDMPRLLWSFQRVGLHPIPYTLEYPFMQLRVSQFLPSAKTFYQSFYVVHEIIGIAYYRIFF